MIQLFRLIGPLVVPLALVASSVAADPSQQEVEKALVRAASFFREKVSVHGTYLWQYSADLSKREGEGKATSSQGWIQPPGTPRVGAAYLDAWRATTNSYFLDAVRETAEGLIRTQLRSGGWAHSVEFDPELRKKFAYRDSDGSSSNERRNITTFDDDTTQSAIRFLMEADAAFEFQDARIHDAATYALTSVLKAQYPNGAFPQGYDKFPDSGQFPIQKASYPSEWSRTWPSQPYSRFYTLNDNNLATLVETLFEAARILATASDATSRSLAHNCRDGAMRIGEFLLLAQMPEPQPAWAQQYDFQMHPVWARKFEPPAISGGESQGALRTLLKIYRETSDPKFLEPIPRALAYLRKSKLSDGRLARFYELQSNRPLYFTRAYQRTYDDSDVPTHYSFKVGDQLESIANEFEFVRKLSKAELIEQPKGRVPRSASQVQKIIEGLDAQGRWIEKGRMRYHGDDDNTTEIIRSQTFVRNMEILSDYLSAMRPEKRSQDSR